MNENKENSIEGKEEEVTSSPSVENKDNPIVEIDYNILSLEELIQRVSEFSETTNIFSVSKDVENIKSYFYKKLHETKANAKEKFIKNGGLEEEFEYDNSLENKFKGQYKIFKKRKFEHRESIEKEQQKNLIVKKKIIESIYQLTQGTETIRETFENFNELKEKWYNTGAAPIANNNELWNSFHHTVELFYDFIKINRDLRDLDFKRNHEQKLLICDKAEALLKEKSINKIHDELQKLHEKWKELGPVEKEHREPLWNRFKEATYQLHKKRNDHYVALKEKSAKALIEKQAVCQKITEINNNLNVNSHKQWELLTKEVQELESQWKSLGRLEKSDDKIAWKELKSTLDVFYTAKKNYFKNRRNESKETIARKIAICEKAESYIESTDWKKTTEALIKLQNDWKISGYLRKDQSEKLWLRFRTACDKFFDNKEAHFKDKLKEKNNNFELKSAMLEEVKKFKLNNDKKQNLEALQDFQKKWTSLGYVSKNKQKIESQFIKEIDGFYKKLKIDKSELDTIRFKNKVDEIKTSGDEFRLNKEKQNLQIKISDLQKEITQYENNISFFSNSKGAETLKKGVEKKIIDLEDTIKRMQEKIKILNKI